MGGRRIARAIVLAAVALATAAAPARASDVADACDGGQAQVVAGEALPADARAATSLRGSVDCGAPAEIAIHSLTWTRPDGSAVEGGPRACSGCSELSSQAADVLGENGEYTLTMRYDVTGPRGSVAGAVATETYLWDGVELSRSADHWTRACGAGPGTATLDLTPDSYGTRLRITGRVACPGASVAIEDLVLATPGGSPAHAAPASCAAPCTGGATTWRQVSWPPGPRYYEASMRFRVSAPGGASRTVTALGRWLVTDVAFVRLCPMGVARPRCLP
jgi:hypothetical protein